MSFERGTMAEDWKDPVIVLYSIKASARIKRSLLN